MAGEPGGNPDGFAASEARFHELVGTLKARAGTATMDELGRVLTAGGRQMLRQMFQDTLDLGAIREPRLAAVVDAQGRDRPRAEPDHGRSVETTFGVVVGDPHRLQPPKRGQPAPRGWRPEPGAGALLPPREASTCIDSAPLSDG